MNTRKMLPTLLFVMLLSVTLLACDSGSSTGSTGSANNGAVSQPTTSTASNPPPSSGSSATTIPANSSDNGGDIKLTVVKYVAIDRDHILGILKNVGNTTAIAPVVLLMDDSGHMLDGQLLTGLDSAILQPGQSAGFSVEYGGADIKHPQFKASGTARPADAPQVAQLTLSGSQFTTSASGALSLEGQVKNDSDLTSVARVNAIFYDDSGNIVDVSNDDSTDDGNNSGIVLQPHSTMKFHINLTSTYTHVSSASGVKATKYDLSVYGLAY